LEASDVIDSISIKKNKDCVNYVKNQEKKLEDIVKPLSILFYSLEPLIEKTLTLLIQLPPFLLEKKGFGPLQGMIRYLDKRFRYSLEVRHSSWFNDNVFDLLKENNILSLECKGQTAIPIHYNF
jgi:uncharacterized protein YecE (DUF72 family)